ncbi:DUF6129 family protein [Beggiatoa leptomitoformis]|uniref:DUF6129 domain-containing protein n=1 Tax=Beggiatoa leptomitoformis TaxID=288004 RepID=A0A2N9YB02_9GAMM|nr:DUF6129 family protein [Beggiatoa leptomitoformis]ALG66999.1 hypothetical protein AL038_03780 [Beggiatoa leptomitoformis]AUI67630.1 hypothetical protein BLE401_02240 [Beggiatoa leptomitoformis]
MLTVDIAEQIALQVELQGLDEATITTLRQSYPHLHFTYCMDDDINTPKPVLERQGFNVYLIDGREHCLKLTSHFETATGLVLAEVVADDK